MMQPPSSPGQEDAVMTEEVTYDEGWQQTQQATQGAVYNSYVDAHLWGFLQPCSAAIARMDFLKPVKVIDIGRNLEGNLFVLPGFKVSEYLTGFCALHALFTSSMLCNC
jgi:ser/thr/tyr protein kinase RAD53